MTAWRFCYYTNNVGAEWRTYEAAFGLYRNQGEGFELLSQTEGRVSKRGYEFTDSTRRLTCEILELSTPYNIEEGYHIGVCLFDCRVPVSSYCGPRGIYPLPTIAEGVTGTSLKHSISYCVDSLPIDIYTTDLFNTLHDHALHVSLQVGESISFPQSFDTA